jgi:hypothetical protein
MAVRRWRDFSHENEIHPAVFSARLNPQRAATALRSAGEAVPRQEGGHEQLSDK